jgi:hypothetical protein
MLSLVEGSKVYTTTAGALSHALFGDEQAMNKGYYVVPEFGYKKIPYRKVPTNALVILTPIGTSKHQLLVKDEDGGWIADRFGPVLGARDTKKVMTKLGLGDG